MKKLICLSVLWAPVALQAATVGQVTADTVRMKPQVITQQFLLQPGDEFSQERYQKAQEELHKWRVFKKLEFFTHERADEVDIHISGEDGAYLFPVGFITGGSKSAGGISVSAGNLFKRGESTFVFGGAGKDGWVASVGVRTSKQVLSFQYMHLDLDPRFYQNGWFNIPGVFATADDKKDHSSALLREIKGTQNTASLLYSYRLSHILRVLVRPQYNEIRYRDHQLDTGRHHQLGVGFSWQDDIRPGLNMGALSGYGLTDKKQSLKDLPRMRMGYTGDMLYTMGGKWTGSEYTISKLAVENTWFLELKTRHLLMLQVSLAEAFQAPFSDQIASTDLLSRQGRYDRQRRGDRGAGVSFSFAYYVLRNKVGLLSLTPFYELAYVKDSVGYRPHSGIGGTLSYKLWRFPLPFGVNYTQNLQDGSHQIGFVVGGNW